MGRPTTQQVSEVRILLVGEDGVGKTSLIMSLISEEFPTVTPAKLDEVTIPADVTPERVPTHIVDYSTTEGSEKALQDEILRASVICIVYDVTNEATVEKITSFWMPTILQVLGAEHDKPVILVGNKCDENRSQNLDNISPIMNEFREIETVVECSAKTLENISELFYYAQKAVLHPTTPLYVSEDKELTQTCKKSLVRIFKICDHDNDGLLNDSELNQFQLRCFGTPLSGDSLNDLKAVVKGSISEGILDNALTLKGFLFLQTLFLRKGRNETTWTVLRRFGYDNSLQLRKDYLYPPLNIPRGSSTELSFDGLQFLTALFEKYDEDRDNCLSPSELQNLFSVCPVMPWGQDALNSCETNRDGWITYNGYLSYWSFLTLLELPRTLEYLAYLGFNVAYPSQLAAIRVTADKRLDWKERTSSRSVYQCHVIGPKDVGKTAFGQSFLNRSLQQQAGVNRKQFSHYAVNSVQIKGGQDKYMVLHEIDVLTPEDALTAYELSCDVAVFIYDVSNPHSFEYCARMYKKYFYRTRIPCLLVATKTDRRKVIQQYEYQPEEFCRNHRLRPAIEFSASEPASWPEVYSTVATLAAYPHLAKYYYRFWADPDSWTKVILGVAAAGLVACAFGSVLSRRM